MTDALGRWWKLVIVLAAGLATYSFFQPFYQVRLHDSMVAVPAYRIVLGFSDVAQIDPALRARTAAEQQLLLAAANEAVRTETVDNPNQPSQASRVPIYYASAVILLVVAAGACARRRLGLLGSLFTIGAGLCALWGYTRTALIERHAAAIGDLAGLPGTASYWLAVAGLLALLAGIGAMVWPDPGGFRAPRTISALLRRGDGPVEVEMPSDDRSAAIPTATLKAAPRRPRRPR